MRAPAVLAIAALAIVSLAACSAQTSVPEAPAAAAVDQGAEASYAWRLPPGFPRPLVPTDNPMSAAKAELGRRLFYDTRLSGNETYSCASCHRQELAFTDGLPRAVGSTGEIHPRGSMSLANAAYSRSFNWADAHVERLEDQALVPMFNRDPIELGLAGRESEIEARLREEPLYRELFAGAFGAQGDPVSLDNARRALASFVRTLISGDSPYDRLVFGDDRAALSEEAWAGMRLFHSQRLGCFECHSGVSFSAPQVYVGAPPAEPVFHNTGLYSIGTDWSYPPRNRGLYEHSLSDADMGRFKAPTLRNIELTAPYMHDGSIETLEAVIDHYAAGGREISSGPYAGDGRRSLYKSELITGFEITPEERRQVVAFLESLTDARFVTNPCFSDPWLRSED